MINFNLLPWRAQQRKHQQQVFILSLSGVVGLCLCTLFVMQLVINHMASIQQTRNHYLSQEIQFLNTTIKRIQGLDQTRQALIERSLVIQALQQARPSLVHTFDQIARTVPNNLHLVALQQQGENIELTGMAESNASISSYMLNIENSTWLGAPILSIISSQEDAPNRPQHFSMSLTQRAPQHTLSHAQ